MIAIPSRMYSATVLYVTACQYTSTCLIFSGAVRRGSIGACVVICAKAPRMRQFRTLTQPFFPQENAALLRTQNANTISKTPASSCRVGAACPPARVLEDSPDWKTCVCSCNLGMRHFRAGIPNGVSFQFAHCMASGRGPGRCCFPRAGASFLLSPILDRAGNQSGSACRSPGRRRHQRQGRPGQWSRQGSVRGVGRWRAPVVILLRRTRPQPSLASTRPNDGAGNSRRERFHQLPNDSCIRYCQRAPAGLAQHPASGSGLRPQAGNQIFARRSPWHPAGDIYPGHRTPHGAGFHHGVLGHPVRAQQHTSGSRAEVRRLARHKAREASEQEVINMLIRSDAAPEAVSAVRDSMKQSAARQAGDRAKLTLQGFLELERYLAPISGRKNVFWFSGSFPIGSIPSAMPNHPEDSRTAEQKLGPARVAIYPISAVGLLNASGAIMDPSQGLTTRATATLPNPAQAAGDNDQQIAMESIARETGGQAFYNTNGLDRAITQAVADGGHYYTMAYTPANAALDGKFRDIRVRLAKGNYKISYRRGYYAEPGAPQSANVAPQNPLLELMRFGMPDFDQIAYNVRAAPENPQPPQGSPPAGANRDLRSE